MTIWHLIYVLYIYIYLHVSKHTYIYIYVQILYYIYIYICCRRGQANRVAAVAGMLVSPSSMKASQQLALDYHTQGWACVRFLLLMFPCFFSSVLTLSAWMIRMQRQQRKGPWIAILPGRKALNHSIEAPTLYLILLSAKLSFEQREVIL